MKKENKTVKVFRYLALLFVITFGLVSIIGSGGDEEATAVYPRFAYVANHTENSVSFYAVEDDTGRLRYQGRVAAGDGPRSVTVDPSGSYAYVANTYDKTISQYTIGFDGTLTPMDPATVLVDNIEVSGLWSITVDPSGSYAYVASTRTGACLAESISTQSTLTALWRSWIRHS